MSDTECEKCKVNKYCGTCITCEQVKEMYQQGRTNAIDECIKTINALNIEYAYPHTICNILEQLKEGARK